jgi:peptidyl-prolyl cis-trans isomerase B (cyclophilin B)
MGDEKMKKKNIILVVVLLILVVLLSSCLNIGGSDLNQLRPPEKGEEVVVMTTEKGTIKIRLFPDAAPKAVENFKVLAKEGRYDGKVFYRIKKDYFIHSEEGIDGESIWGGEFEDEFNKDYRHFYGALSMANSGPNTNTSGFFIVQRSDMEDDIIELMEEIGDEGGFSDGVIKGYKKLGGGYDWDDKHTVFGQVFQGMDVVDAIANADTVGGEPINEVVIEKVEVIIYEGK